MKKKISWILVFFMLLASFWQVAGIRERAVCAAERQAAGKEWRLTGRIFQSRKVDCKEESRYENLLGRGGTVTGTGIRGARGLQILLGLIILYFLIFAGRKEGRGISPPAREPVRMRTVRYIHFAYGL